MTSSVVLVTLSAVAGLIVGSFLTMLVARVPDGQPLLRPGPSCRSCGRGWSGSSCYPSSPGSGYEAAAGPVTRRSAPRHPAIEITTAVLFAVTSWRLGPTPELGAVLAFVAGGVALAAIDLEHFRLPTRLNRATLALVLLGLAVAAVMDRTIDPLVTAAVGAALFSGVLSLPISSRFGRWVSATSASPQCWEACSAGMA